MRVMGRDHVRGGTTGSQLRSGIRARASLLAGVGTVTTPPTDARSALAGVTADRHWSTTHVDLGNGVVLLEWVEGNRSTVGFSHLPVDD